MGYKESEETNDRRWVMEMRKKIEKLKEQLEIEEKVNGKIKILKQIIGVYESLNFESELNDKDREDVKKFLDQLDYYEYLNEYYKINRVEEYNPKTREFKEVGGNEDWEEER